MPPRLPTQVAAVALAAVVGLGVAARPDAPLPTAPDCATSELHVAPLYDDTRPGLSTPQAAVGALAATGHLGEAASALLVDEADRADALEVRTLPGEAAVAVVGREAGAVLVVARVIPHPAGGWQVDVAKGCSS